jgi:hypothetical protein
MDGKLSSVQWIHLSLNINEYFKNECNTIQLSKCNMDQSLPQDYMFNMGMIAQEVYYDCPELRHLVAVPETASNISDHVESAANIADIVDYSSWGADVAGLNYTGFIPMMIKGFQEQNDRLAKLENALSNLVSRIP